MTIKRRPITRAIQTLMEREIDPDTQRPIQRPGEKPIYKKDGRITVLAKERAAATGLLPHEILLSLARGEPFRQRMVNEETGEVKFHVLYPDLADIKDAAKASAQYFAPKLSAVQTISGATDEELDAFIASAAAEAGIGAGLGGEVTEEEGSGGEGSQ